MLGLICVCGGNLFRSEYGENNYEEYVCDLCDRVWFRCNLCNGDLHAYGPDELDLAVEYKDIDTIEVRRDITVRE